MPTMCLLDAWVLLDVDALLNSGALRDVSTLLNAGTLLVSFR